GAHKVEFSVGAVLDGSDDIRTEFARPVLRGAHRASLSIVSERVDEVLHIVGVEICSSEPRDGRTTVHRAANDSGSPTVVVVEDRWRETGVATRGEGRAKIVSVETGGAFLCAPAEVLPRVTHAHDVELFFYVLTDIADVQI